MLLRPATPLSIILVAAFALLLLSTISVPILKSIPLATDRGWKFGVFGYCDINGNNCVKPHIGYTTDQLFGGTNGDFTLAPGSRNTLSYILIVHPIAAFFTLICAILALTAHFHAPSSSARFLLALLIFTIPAMLMSLLAFLVDILLFVPRLGWGGWIVLGATILNVASSILICAMRRTLISRKARTKRIEENADMNGTNYYNNLNEHRLMTDALPRADSPPPITSDKSSIGFATFETKSHESAARTSEDRAPLNPMRDPSMRSASTGPGGRQPYDSDPLQPMPLAPRSQFDDGRSMNNPPSRPSRDEYGNPLPYSQDGPDGPMLRPSNSRGSLTSNGSVRGMPYGRGRGYGPPQRGYGPRGGYGSPRGNYASPRGGYGPRGGYRGGPPPPGYNGRGGPGYSSQRPYGQSPTGYGPPQRRESGDLDPYYSSNPGSQTDYRRPSPDNHYGHEPNTGIGQAIEMNERTGSPPVNMRYGSGMQDSKQNAMRTMSPPQEGYGFSETNAYTAPRTDWKPMAPPNAAARFSPDNASSHYSSGRAIMSPSRTPPTNSHHTRAGSENYYEDVDARFAADGPGSDQYQNIIQEHQHPHAAMPNALMPGNAFSANNHNHNTSISTRMASPIIPDPSLLQPPPQNHSASQRSNRQPSTDRSNSNSSLEEQQQQGTRSPTGSENSHFTSISQRPVNPHWRPGYSGGGTGSSAVAAKRRKEDIILNGNPDFAIPGIGAGRGGQTKGERTTPALNQTPGFTPSGRYPTEI